MIYIFLKLNHINRPASIYISMKQVTVLWSQAYTEQDQMSTDAVKDYVLLMFY